MRAGKYYWWCGGTRGEGDGPEYLTEDLGPLFEGATLHDYDTIVICRTCRRLAPNQNGCRWKSTPLEDIDE